MADVVGFTLVFHGRDGEALGGAGDPTTAGIVPNATGGIRVSLQLRQTDRFRGEVIDEAYLVEHGEFVGDPEELRVPVQNSSTGTVDDAARNPAVDPTPPSQEASAEVEPRGLRHQRRDRQDVLRSRRRQRER
ncbi:hypothetical protein [Demequina litorisediminis]|uniref:Uncharacterized protein n=1 Tax=Demequina litorisediminis TaxID=1849022 RepID=A0ABQ6IFI4_9MICO|nr:hypothetical protein [Demequina litorisediminis]GMA35504.1 hypothetical protein GCM10025876_17080 [Demequina litorisediminis]